MLESPLILEGSAEITIDGEPVIATCGPIRTEPVSEFEDGVVKRRKISGPSDKLPTTNGVVVDIDGEEWAVEHAAFSGETVIVTFIGYLQ